MKAAGISSQPTSGILFHYTSAIGLRGILESGNIFGSHVGFLNDTSEWDYGVSIIAKRLPQLAAAGLPSWVDGLNTALNDKMGCEFYAACFCEEDDLLPQ